jgi:peptidyl-prolyl cis-trans isomerase A (cyclophilin A)
MYRLAGYVDSAKAEFFINVGNNPVLDKRHRDGAAFTVFAKVVEGMDVVDRIASVKVGTHRLYGKGRTEVVPVKPVTIKSATMLSAFDHRAAETMVQSAELATKKAVVEGARTQERMVSQRVAAIEKQYGMPMTTMPSGLKYLVIRSGTGAPPIASETVTVHYIGTLADGSEFENTYTREGSRPVKKIVSKFIVGLQNGIQDMHEGEKRVFVVPSELGFRDVGIPQRIEPDATLFFELELLSIEPG